MTFSLSRAVKNYDFIKRFWIWLSIPLAIILIGAIVGLVFGINIGMDFTGGTSIEINLNGNYAENNADYTAFYDDINDILASKGIDANIRRAESDSDTKVYVEYKKVVDDMEALNDELVVELRASYKQYFTGDEASNIKLTEKSTPSVNETLARAVIAISVAAVIMLIYICIRFDWKSGLSAVVTLVINTLVMIAMTVVCRIEINMTFIAAVITIIGYSINATIVIFDRIRENKKKAMHAEGKTYLKDIANISIRESFTRTVYTTVTTLVTIAVLAIIAVASIQEFALPIIFGLLIGIFSSIFIAPALWVLFSGDKLNVEKIEKKAKA